MRNVHRIAGGAGAPAVPDRGGHRAADGGIGSARHELAVRRAHRRHRAALRPPCRMAWPQSAGAHRALGVEDLQYR